MDPRAALWMLAFNGLLFAVAITVLSARYRRHASGLVPFVVASLGVGVNFALVALRGEWSPWLTVVTANVAHLWGMQAMARGIDQLERKPRPLLLEAFFAAGSAALLAVAFGMIEHAWARTTVLSGLTAYWALRCAWTLSVRGETRLLRAGRVLALPFWMLGVLDLTHYAWRVVTGTFPSTLLDRTPGGLAFVFVASLITFAIGVGPLFLWQERAERELADAALTDPLTGLRNRRAFFDDGELLLAQHRRNGRPLTLLALDVDHFKRINDRFGHAGGDAALRHFARLLHTTLRVSDLVARTGGEEFCVLLFDTDLRGAQVVAARLLDIVRNTSVEIEGTTIRLTSSVGIAARADDTASLDALLARADQALYVAKDEGRDTVRTVT